MSEECPLCAEEGQLVSGCGTKAHAVCVGCWAKLLDSAFSKTSCEFFAGKLKCPDNRCSRFLPMQFVLEHASKETKAEFESGMRTVPKTLSPWPSALADFNYAYNSEGRLRRKDTGGKYLFVSQRQYDALGDCVVSDIQKMLLEQKLEEVWLPEGKAVFGGTATRKVRVGNNIFLSPDALTNEGTLMVLIQGSGAVRAGMWARALCINETLEMGTVLPYVADGLKQGWGIAILNPNLNSVAVPTEDAADGKGDGSKEGSGSGGGGGAGSAGSAAGKEEKKESKLSEEEAAKQAQAARDFFCSTTRTGLATKNVKIPGNEGPREHTLHVWDNFLKKAKAKHIVIVAHSAGGACTMALLKMRGSEILPKLRAVAFTDSVHEVLASDPAPVKSFIRSNAINYVTSDKPLDTPIPVARGARDGCPCVSAGHTKHEWTSGTARTSVFKFFAKQLAAASAL